MDLRLEAGDAIDLDLISPAALGWASGTTVRVFAVPRADAVEQCPFADEFVDNGDDRELEALLDMEVLQAKDAQKAARGHARRAARATRRALRRL